MACVPKKTRASNHKLGTPYGHLKCFSDPAWPVLPNHRLALPPPPYASEAQWPSCDTHSVIPSPPSLQLQPLSPIHFALISERQDCRTEANAGSLFLALSYFQHSCLFLFPLPAANITRSTATFFCNTIGYCVKPHRDTSTRVPIGQPQTQRQRQGLLSLTHSHNHGHQGCAQASDARIPGSSERANALHLCPSMRVQHSRVGRPRLPSEQL